MQTICHKSIDSTKMEEKQKMVKKEINNGVVRDRLCNRESFLPQVERAVHLWFCNA